MFKGNRIVRIVRGRADRNHMGGKVWIITGFWNKWADVRERSGFPDQSQQQTVWQYEQEIKIRYEPTRPTHSNDLILYNNTYYKINSLRLSNEATIDFEVMRCVKSDELIKDTPPMNVNNPLVWNYTGTGAEGYSVTAPDLIGQVPLTAFKDGPSFEIIPNDENSATVPDGNFKQVHIDALTGATTWSQPILPNEQIQVLYYGT